MADKPIPEMVERVKRAISPWICAGAYCYFTDDCPCTKIAKAAMKAMREPTEAMAEGSEWIRPRYDDPMPSNTEIWRAMIAAALGE